MQIPPYQPGRETDMVYLENRALTLARRSASILLLVVLIAACGDSGSIPQEPTPEPAGNIAIPATATVAATQVSAPGAPTADQVTPEPETTPTATLEPAATVPATMTVPASPTPTATPAPSAFEVAGLEEDIDELLAGVEGVVSVALQTDDGAFIYSHNPDESMEAASIYKLPVMVEVFRQLEAGDITLDTGVLVTISYFAEGADSIGYEGVDSYYTLETLLFAMIAQSSNVAAYALLDLVGNDAVNATMRELGLDGIEIRWSPRILPPWEVLPEVIEEEWVEPNVPDSDPPGVEAEPDDPGEEVVPDEESAPEDSDEDVEDVPVDEEGDPDDSGSGRAAWLTTGPRSIVPTMRADDAYNVVTAQDIAALLAMIQRGEVVSEQASADMLDLLLRQQIPGGLGMQLPPETIAHKTGYLEDGVVNDAGIIWTPSGPVVAVVLTEGVREDIAYYVMSEIGRLVFEAGSTGP